MTKITILDGSIGQELVHRHGKPPTPHWSTSVMLENPDLVAELHRDYFAAGAEVATTNTYAVLPDRMEKFGGLDQLEALLDTAGRIARDARDAHGSGMVAASLGPLGASYRPDLRFSDEEAERLYKPVVEVQAPYVDFYLAETVSSVEAAGNCAHAMTRLTDKPCWLALSTDDDDGTRLRSGEPVGDALKVLDHDQIEAVLINCTRPEVVADALAILSDCGKPTGAYANGFTRISQAFLSDAPTADTLTARKDRSPEAYADFAQAWVDAGATIIGGCCEVGPAHIAELKRRFG